MKIYVASSWRNVHLDRVIERLRDAGHDVYDFRTPGSSFSWKELDKTYVAGQTKWSADTLNMKLKTMEARVGFQADMRALDAAEAVVLVLPCGRSAHLELGYGVGKGKIGLVLQLEPEQPDLMYLMCQGNGVLGSIGAVVDRLELPK